VNKFVLFFLVLIYSVGFVSAVDVAYISDSSLVNAKIAGILDGLGLSFETIRNSELTSSTDFSEYKAILVADDVSREEFLPLEEKNAIFFHRGIAEEAWNLASSGRTTKSFMKSTNLGSFVYEGVEIDLATNEFRVYSSAQDMHHLVLGSQSGVISVGLNTGNSPRPSVVYSEKNNNGEVVRNFFFGAPVFNEWTQNSEKILENVLVWLLAEIDEDNDGWPAAEDCNDSNSDIYPGADEIPYDGIDQNCDGFDLEDVDGDGFVSDIVGGSDCDDSDADVFPENSDKNLDCVNSPPEIISYIPEERIVRLLENTDKIFSIEVVDVDSDFEISWILDGVVQSTTTDEFSLSKSEGVYSLEVIVRDEESSVRKSWSIIFGTASGFSCSEVGGEICTENNVCGGSVLEVEDSNACCLSSCLSDFKDNNSCEVVDSGLVLELKSVENPELGNSIRVQFEVRNNLGEDQNINVMVDLYNLDDGKSVSDVGSEADIKDGSSKVFNLDLEIPDDIEPDDNYAVLLKAEGDGDSCNQIYKETDVDRPDDLVVISGLDFFSEAVCEGVVSGRVKIENLGLDKQDVKLFVENRDLGLNFRKEFGVESYGGDDSFTQEFDIDVPEEIDGKEHLVNARIDYRSKSDSFSRSISVRCGDPKNFENSNVVPLSEKINLGEGERVVRGDSERAVEPNYGLIAFIMMLNFVILASVGLFYLSWLKKKSRDY